MTGRSAPPERCPDPDPRQRVKRLKTSAGVADLTLVEPVGEPSPDGRETCGLRN